MVFEMMKLEDSLTQKLMQRQAIDKILECNQWTARYGLVLTQAQAAELAETRTRALKGNGRIEFGGGILEKMIKEFCSSPYMRTSNFSSAINELVEIFYYYKNETLDQISDDDLIRYMHDAFDGSCRGSLELLSGRELAIMARRLRFGGSPDDEAEMEEEDSSFEEEYGDGDD